jgi:hypothetical protein
MKKINPHIYSVVVNDKKRYFGKTTNATNKNELRPSIIHTNPKLKELINNNSKVEIVKESDENWRNEKIKIINEENKTNKELIHPQWMLDGLKCHPNWGYYWVGKKKDQHTINQLSKSKYIRICQYSKEGNLIKIWDGIKEAAIEIIKDYSVVNGSGCTILYTTLSNMPWNRLCKDSYWFKESEIIEYFGVIVNNFDIQYFTNCLRKIRKQKYKKRAIGIHHKRFEILEYYRNNKLKERYSNADDASNKLKLSSGTIRRYCRSKKNCKTTNTYFRYSEKKVVI